MDEGETQQKFHPTTDPNAPLYPVFVFSIFLLLSIPVRMLIKKYNFPLAPNVFHISIAAILTMFLVTIPALYTKYGGISNIHPQYFISVFIPVFIVARIYRMDFYIFIRCLPQTILISTVGFLLNALTLGFIIRDILHPNWTFPMGILSGVIAVPVQPNYIINMFKELAKYKYLGTMLESETILTFIPVMICYIITTGVLEGILIYWYHFVFVISRYIIGGIIAGLLFGKVTSLLMCWLYNEPLGALSVSIGMTFLTYYTCEFVLYCSGILAVVCVVCFIAIEKHRFSSEVDNCIYSFWGTLNYIVEIAIIMNCTMEIVAHIYVLISPKKVYGTIITYFAANITRFLSFLILGLILNRMAYDMNLRCLMVLGWSGVKGNMNLMLILLALSNSKTNKMAQHFILEVMVFTFLSLSINSTSMRMTLKLIGLSELSPARRINMNNCMKFIMEKRLSIINILKLNRYLSDANWTLVRKETVMKHPYKLKMTEEEEDDDNEFLWNSRNLICPDCFKEVPLEISEKEMEEMLRDAQVKILKAKKVSVIKQYEKGTINKNCLQVLANTLEIMIESNPKSNAIEMKSFLEQNKLLKFAQKILMRVNSDKIYQPPKPMFKKLCFYVMMHKAYDWVIYVGILASCAFILLEIEYSNSWTFILVNIFIWIFFVNDFVIKVLGLSRIAVCVDGLKHYFSSYWNVFDFIMLFNELVFIVYIINMTTLGYENRIARYTLQGIRLSRSLRIFYLLRSISPKMLKGIEYQIDSKICFGYDLATAVVNCCDEIFDIISTLVEVRLIRDLLLKQIYDEKRLLLKEMEQVQKERPWIAITVKTKQAIRTTLNAMEEALNELKFSGFVDNIEYALIYKEIFEKQKFLRNMKFVQPSPPKVIFNEVPWMAEDGEIIEFLYTHVQTVSWDAGEIVCKDGSFSLGVYIVVTGLLRLKYTPKEIILEKSREFGKIPIVDYLSTLKFENNLDDNIMSGNSIGELSVLTGRPYDCTIIADSPSQAYLITTDVIKEAMKINGDPVKGLECRMWKCTTINLAVAVLMDIPLYQSFTQEQIKFKLERAFMPNLRCYKMFVITEMMDDVILLEGVALDYNSGDLFTAPMLIPRTIQKLILPKSSYLTMDEIVETRLLIIPMGEAKEYEIMEYEEEVAELVSVASSKCLLHVIQDQSRKKKKGSTKRKLEKDTNMLTKESEEDILFGTTAKIVNLDDGKSFSKPLEQMIRKESGAASIMGTSDSLPMLLNQNMTLMSLSQDELEKSIQSLKRKEKDGE